MKAELINKAMAFQRYLETKDIAFAIAEANGTLPGYCEAPECKLHVAYAALATELREGEVCIFIDGYPASWLTDFTLDNGSKVIGKLCTKNVIDAFISDELLHLKYSDGVIERYVYLTEVDAYTFLDKNISINLPSTSIN